MRWVREHRLIGTRLALFALALQLILSFGHVHSEDFGFVGPAHAVTVSAPSTGAPAGDLDEAPGHDYCALCATLALASTLTLPAPPALPMPVIEAPRWDIVASAEQIDFDLHAAFQARAPPAA